MTNGRKHQENIHLKGICRHQANKKNAKSVNDINFKNWLWREYHIKLEDIILLESQLNENLALALRHQNKIGITHTSDGIRITEENKCDPVIQKQIYEDWKKNSGQYDPKNDVIPEWEMDALHPRTVNDIKFEQYLLREYGMTRKEEIEKTFGGNIDALSRILTPVDIFTLGAAAVAKLTGKKVWKEVGEEVGEKTVKTVAGETREILEKELVEGTTDDVAKIVIKVEKENVAVKSGKHSLSNVEARKWYFEQEARILNMIDKSLSLEKQAEQAFNLRNQFRTQARELMADRNLAEALYKTDPNKTWEEMIQRQIDKGFTGDDIYKEIIASSQRSRKSVNKSLGLE